MARMTRYSRPASSVRPIMMTPPPPCWGLPLALSFRHGGELRRPWASHRRGLVLSQVLTLIHTGSVFYLDRLRLWTRGRSGGGSPGSLRHRLRARLKRLNVVLSCCRCCAAAGGPDTSVPTCRAARVQGNAGWKPSQPRDDIDQGCLVSVYNDPNSTGWKRMVKSPTDGETVRGARS